MKKGIKFYAKLFAAVFQISAFTFGGGFVIIPLLKKKFVDDLSWIDETEMLDLAAIAQSSPGAIAVNASILVGYRLAGLAGAAVAVLGTVLPPLIILSVISVFYTAFRESAAVSFALKGMQAGVAAVIADVVVKMAGDIIKEKRASHIAIMAGAFIAVQLLGINVIFVILGCGFIGALMAFKAKLLSARH